MTIERITCPDCGLLLRVVRDASGSEFVFDTNEWQSRCKLPDLGAPVWCLICRDGTSAITESACGSCWLDLARPELERGDFDCRQDSHRLNAAGVGNAGELTVASVAFMNEGIAALKYLNEDEPSCVKVTTSTTQPVAPEALTVIVYSFKQTHMT